MRILLLPTLLWCTVVQLARADTSNARHAAHASTTGAAAVWVRNYFGTKYLSNVRVILVSSSGRRDTVITDARGIATFVHVDPGQAFVWESLYERGRDTVAVVPGRVVRDTIFGLPRMSPPPVYR